MQQTKHCSLLGLWAALLLCVAVVASPAPMTDSLPAEPNCPVDCNCIASQHPHRSLLHVKCNSTRGLKGEQPLRTSLPVHSIDLSHLHLSRVASMLDKLPELTSADLSHNELHEIGHLSKSLKKLNLKSNHLTSAKLVRLPQHLQTLNLAHNDISYLPLELTHLHNLQQLDLSHNNIDCNCETLEVRNWLQTQHVFMEHAVICSYPIEARGKSWLQLKQTDVCSKQHNSHPSDIDDKENELMMGDQPANESAEDKEEEEELGKAYLPIQGSSGAKSIKIRASDPLVTDDVEGSGDLSNSNMRLSVTDGLIAATTAATAVPVDTVLVTDEDNNDEGSGSGDGLVVIPSLQREPIIPDDFDTPDSNEGKDKDDEFDEKPVEEPAGPSADIFNNMGIFEGAETDNKKPEPVSEETIVPVVHTQMESGAPTDTDVVTDGPLDGDSSESESILSAKIGKKDDSNATYYLLGVIGLIVVGLILFVAIKRCKYNSNAAARDAEAQRQTELLVMDKGNLGKPLLRNGTEHIPLIGEKTKLDDAQIITKPYNGKDSGDGAGQQPLLNGNGNGNGNAANGNKEPPTINEPADEPASHEYYPITPRYPTPQSPRASKYAQHPQAGEQNNNELDSAYLASSPKSGRYSPVYSPETGRVKIKLTETPKPKTPMLVTRSKSNAGDMITTPVHSDTVYQQLSQPVNGLSH